MQACVKLPQESPHVPNLQACVICQLTKTKVRLYPLAVYPPTTSCLPLSCLCAAGGRLPACQSIIQVCCMHRTIGSSVQACVMYELTARRYFQTLWLCFHHTTCCVPLSCLIAAGGRLPAVHGYGQDGAHHHGGQGAGRAAAQGRRRRSGRSSSWGGGGGGGKAQALRLCVVQLLHQCGKRVAKTWNSTRVMACA